VIDRHRRDPISFRPAAADFDWLERHAEKTGKPVRRILAEALTDYREKHDPDTKENDR
jgi:hypothetical protein